MDKDNLIDGPFGSNACYKNTIDGIDTYMCFGSGFTTSTLMQEGSKLVKDTLETSPELYKDLMHKDKEGLVWFPATITVPGSGMVFADGANTKDVKWSAVLAKELSQEEIDSGKYPEGQTIKMDMVNKKEYPFDRGFMDALEYIGFFKVPLSED